MAPREYRCQFKNTTVRVAHGKAYCPACGFSLATNHERAPSPAELAKDAQRRELAAIRAKAWVTRRKKYGPNGNGKYNAPGR